MKDEIMKITLFQEFTIEYHGTLIKISDVATRQLQDLLQIFVYYRRNPISKDKLIELMWQDNENPLNVMKFSIFRLRGLLKGIEVFKDIDLIVTTKTGYCFNPEIEVAADFEQVDDAWKIMNDEACTLQNSIKNAKCILDLYRGPLFVRNTDFWMIQAQSYYQNIYHKAFDTYCSHLLQKKDLINLIDYAQKAVDLDQFHEDAWYYYLQGLIEDHQYHRALTMYKNVQDLFYQEFGHPLSLRLKNLYNIIVAQDEEEEIDVETLKEKLNANIDEGGAFYCEYELFKHIYQVEIRNAIRDSKEQFLVVFELRSQLNDKVLLQAMEKLKAVVKSSLRKGDVYSRMNKTQLVILLPCQNIDNGYSIIQRITSNFYRKIARSKVKLHYFISPLTQFDDKSKDITLK